jgi:CRP-like cAMP-binding protein
MNFNNIYNHTSFSEKEMEVIKSVHEKTTFRKGEFLLKEKQIAKEYYCVESGTIRAFAIDTNGNQITTNFFSKNEIAIEPSSLFLNEKTKENIQALTDCVCWKIKFEDFQKLFQTVPYFSDWGRLWMTKELLNSKQRSISIITDSAKERYLEFKKSKPDATLHAPLKHIASYLGITDSTLSKIRRELSKR